MTDKKPSKTLIQHALGDEISKEDAEIFFGKDIIHLFEFPVKLVAINFTIQDSDGLEMDYKLKTKDYVEQEDDDGGLTHRVELGDDEDD